MQSFKDKNAAMHSACPAEKIDRADGLLEVTKLWNEKEVIKKKDEQLTPPLVQALSVQEKRVADKSHTENAGVDNQ